MSTRRIGWLFVFAGAFAGGGRAQVADPPAIISSSPPSSTQPTQSFTFTVRDSNGYADIRLVYVVVNWAVSGNQACEFEYNRNVNTFRIYQDGTGWSAPVTAGSADPLPNGQCVLDVQNSSASGSGTDLGITARVTLKPGFFGPQNIYMLAYDQGWLASGWQQVGTWTGYAAPNSSPPTAVSVLPNAGSGMSRTFDFTARSLNGAGYYLAHVKLLINSPPNENQARVICCIIRHGTICTC